MRDPDLNLAREPMVKRLPHDPNAIDLSAIKRAKDLEAWRKAHPELVRKI